MTVAMDKLREQLNAHTTKQTVTHYGVDFSWTPEEDFPTPIVEKDGRMYKVVSVYVEESWTDADRTPRPFFWMRARSIRKNGLLGTSHITMPYYTESTPASPEFKFVMVWLRNKFDYLAEIQINANGELGFISKEMLGFTPKRITEGL